ncbi:MAG: metallophosphoesterase [Lachnospiraceae bacterium]|nr:metallophosphoesterase [Lachnospiraceae bacterium]
MIISIICVIIIVCVWIMLYDSNRFVVRTYEITDERIRRPLRAVVLADLHNKCYGKGNERLLAEIRACKPDCILIAGDMITARPGKSFETALHVLKELAKDHPIYYGNGNHEHRIKLYSGNYGDMAERYEAALREAGIRRMVNVHTLLQSHGIAIYGSEIDKLYYKRFGVQPMEPDYLERLLGAPDPSVYNVLIAHNPDYFPQYAEWGADLTVSGHVHGGIVRVPFWGRGVISPNIRLFPKYDGGLFYEKGKTMLLSRGLGEHTIPFRLFDPGELWVVDFGPGVRGE